LRTPGLLITWAAPLVVILVVPMPARAFDLSGGVSLGGFQAGTVPRLAVSPNVGITWPVKSDFLFAIYDLCSVLPSLRNDGIGVYNKTSVAIGYTSDNANFRAGPSFATYYITACGLTLCGSVVGVAAGGYAQTDVYFAGPLGVSVSANVDWIGGSSRVLPGGVAVMVVAGPVLRWRSNEHD
jgi:hypothetical protein